MRAIVLESYGGPEVLTMREVPDAVAAPDEVVVRIAATAINRADLLQVKGFYPGPPMPHEIPGMEFAGRIISLGGRVQGREIGDEVMAIVGGGAYAEQVAVHERMLMDVPSPVGLPDAGAIPEVFITAYDALVLQGGLTVGGWALVHAGASGVGTASIQLAKALGARIVVTCSTGKVEACRALGADVVIDYGTEDFAARTLQATGGVGVDVVLDVIGGDYVERNLAACRVGGSIVQVGVMGGGIATVPVGTLLMKRITWIGTTLRSRPIEEKIDKSRRCAHDLLSLFDSGALRPIIDRTYTLDEIADAHRYVATNANVGKVLITVP